VLEKWFFKRDTPRNFGNILAMEMYNKMKSAIESQFAARAWRIVACDFFGCALQSER